MSFEEQINPNHHYHPEVASNPEAMRPASEETKQALLDIVSSKSAGGYENSTGVGRDLRFDDDRKGTIGVNRFRDGASLDDPSRLARITRIEWPGELYGKQLITNYFILNTPDGLQMEKHSQTSDPRKELLSDNASLADIFNAAQSGLARIAELRKAQAIEDELGLSFVSEEEAQALLSLVEEAQIR